ncbi:DUF3137 domain-containing protein [Candidatus Saccharibacteria bacterium]|nr:DUF3137 domain-containing protein [Candidatus Saccharibacteria bacterium]
MNIVSTILSLALIVFGLAPGFGFAGGGGSSSGGGGGYSGGSSYHSSDSSLSSDDDPIITLIAVVVIVIAIVASAVMSKKQIKAKMEKNNSTPEEKYIHEEAERIFKAYQADWSNMAPVQIAAYTTPDYYNHASYQLELLSNLHRVNRVSNLKVNYVALLNPVDSNTPLPATVRVEFGFSGLDEVIDTAKSKTLYKNNAASVTETWNFIYDGKSLKLAGISQPTESAPHLIKSLAEFASTNHLYYSPDWGRYAIPSRGLIFGGHTMTNSDINNHIIGKWALRSAKAKDPNTKPDLLVQLYTYAATPGDPSTYYLVGQINVPKDYLGVIVKSKKYKNRLKPDRSYDKFEMEWPDFNKRYEVYASSRDALPAFELLNPKFMEYLYDKNLNYNLEVADNVIYIFAPVRQVTEADYAELLDVLKLAHKELKM